MFSNQADPLPSLKHSLELAYLRKHRTLLVLAGDDDQYLPQIRDIIKSSALYTNSIAASPDQRTTAQFSKAIMHVPDRHSNSDNSDQINALLGSEHRCLIFDAHGAFEERLFAACAGTLIAGGVLVFRTPPLNQWATRTNGNDSAFIKRLVRKIQRHEPLKFDKPASHSSESYNGATFLITNPETNSEAGRQITQPAWEEEQDDLLAQLIAQLSSSDQSATVIQADRGRGKSALIGRALNHLFANHRKATIHLTASRQSACAVLQQHVEDTAEKKFPITFLPIERALELKHELLIVEEAGSISIPVLIKLTNLSRHIVFATTVQGYEGAGRGFALRFSKQLDRLRPGWVKLQPVQPIRWSPNDPVEAFVNDALLLKTQLPHIEITEELRPEAARLTHIHKHELSNNDGLLEEIYALLIQAHYQTTPADLRHMLEQEKLLVFAQRTNNLLTGAALVALEGEIPIELHEAIVRKQRRLADQILPQVLAQSIATPGVLALGYARIVRIAVHPALHRRGFGTALFKQLRQYFTSDNRIIGASFGADDLSMSFWLKLGFTPIHYGYKINPRSGLRSACVLLGEYPQAKLAIDKAMAILYENLLALEKTTVSANRKQGDQVRQQIIQAIDKPNATLTDAEKIRLVTDFCHSQRSFNDTVGFINLDGTATANETIKAHLQTLLSPDETLKPKQRRLAEQALRDALTKQLFL